MAEKKRYVEYDLMRIIACFCVIMIHAPNIFPAERASFPSDSLAFQAINIWGMLSRWSVPAFVMLSGMMILPHGDEISLKKLMIHRVFRMLGAYVAWSVVYSAYNVFVLDKVYAGTKIKTFIDGCFSGELHMWYLPMLAGLYIASPLLAKLIKSLDKKWSAYWLVCLFAFSSLIPFIVKLNIKYISVITDSINGYMELGFFGIWIFYFVLGYYIKNHSFSKKEKIIVYILSLAALLFTFYGTVIHSYKNGETMGILPYEYPNIVFMSIGVLVFFKETVAKSGIIVRLEKPIKEISKLTFGIYLIHVLLLEIFYTLGVNYKMFNPIVSIPVVSLIVFVCGGIIIWIIRKVPVLGTYFA